VLRPALPRSFYERPAVEVARDLLGRDLVRTHPHGDVAARLVECEAYRVDDPASHSFRGRTARTEVMFGPPGHLYVYLSYGVHWCMNVVTGREGEGSAVLLRAAEPLDGQSLMRSRRGLTNERLLCAGPGRLCQAFGVDRGHNGLDLTANGELLLTAGEPVGDERIAAGPRVGISVAVEQPWRFVVAGDPFVSRGHVRPGRGRRLGPG